MAVTLIALAIGYRSGGLISNYLSTSNLLVYFIGSGLLAATWMNLALLTYPPVISALSSWHFVVGSIIACLYVLFVPLVVFSSLNSVLVALLNSSDEEENRDKDHHAGTVFFVSTIGSVVGVFIAAYYLLNHFSNYASYAILAAFSAALTIVLTALAKTVPSSTKIILYGASLVMLFGATYSAATGATTSDTIPVLRSGTLEKWTVVARYPSFYGNHAVVEIGRKNFKTRALLTAGLKNNEVYENGLSASTFTHALEKLSLSGKEKPRSALVLGLGVGILPARFSKMGIDVDVVQLDQKVVEISKKYFSFDERDVSLTVADARNFVRNCPRLYDVVVVDVFRGDGVPSHMVSEAFFRDVHACLSEGGAMTMNVFLGAKDLSSKKALIKTIAEVFGKTIVLGLPKDHHSLTQSNYILTRKSTKTWPVKLTSVGVPPGQIAPLNKLFRNWKIYNTDSVFLRNVSVIRDSQNDWKRMNSSHDMACRRTITKNVPWQVLVD